MLYPLIGPAGSGKTTYIVDKIRELCLQGEQVLLLVPEQFSFEMERRILFEVGAQAVTQVEVKSFSHYCRKIFMEYGGGAGQRISEAAKYMLMHVTLNEIRDKLKQYGRASTRSGFVPSALKLIDQFKNAGISPSDLQNFSALCGDERLQEKTNELYEIYSVYQAQLENGFSDERENLARAVELLRGKNHFKNTHVFLDSFRDFTPVEREFLSVVMDSCKGIYLSSLANNIAIKGNKSNVDEGDVFKVVKENTLQLISVAKTANLPVASPIHFENSYRFQTEELRWLANSLTALTPEPYNGPCDALRFYEASDAYEELRFVAAQIAHLVKYEGFHYRDFTVIARDLSKYQTSLEQIFGKYEIPVFWDNRNGITHIALIRAVMSALDAVYSNFASEHVLSFAKSPLLGLDYTSVLELENYCYIWNINKDQWLTTWENNPKGISGAFSDEDQMALEQINETSQKIITPLLHLKQELEGADGYKFASALYNFLEEIRARDHLKDAFAGESLLYEQILQQNSEAWDILIDLLDTMATVLVGRYLSLEQICELFRLGIEASDFGMIPNTLDQVSIGTADRIRPNEPKVVFVIGMNQGEFPPQLTEQPFFTDSEREKLLESGIQIGPTIVRQNDYEQLYTYSALTAASQRLYLSYHMSHSDGSECAPSSLFRSLLNLSGGKLLKKADLGELFFATNEETAFEILCRQYRLDNSTVSALYDHVKNSSNVERLERIEEILNRQDFAIDDAQLARELFGSTMRLSPTNVNKYFSCPFSYFCYTGLHLRSRQRADYSRLEAGNLLHHLLSEMIVRHGGKGLAERSILELEAESREIVDNYLKDCIGDPEKLQKRSQYLFRNLAHRASFILKQLADEFAQSEFEPLYCELPIRKGSVVPPVIFETDDGIQLSIEGIVDRVDVMEKNGRRFARVIDYKSGGMKFSFTEMYYGLKLQMLLYLLSICENGSGKLKDAVPGGVLYFPAQDAALSVERNSSPESVQKERRKNYKMAGLVLDDEDCIFGMERPQTKTTKGKEQKQVLGEYIPVKSSSTGWHATQSKVANEQQMKLIFRHIRLNRTA